MLLVLHGAKKNVGDFLIRDRGVELLRRLRPGAEIVTAERWRPLDPTTARKADAIILCGGPGLRRDFYPATFSLGDLEQFETPVLPLALGWSGSPQSEPDAFSFDGASERALRLIHERIGWSSVRDDVSLRIMERANVGAVCRSGCTAWYHLPSMGKRVAVPSSIRSVVFTPPAGSRRLFAESVRVMRLLRSRYPSARRYCVFHRGLRVDSETGWTEAAVVRALAGVASSLGFESVDAAYDLSRIGFYGESDLHVGYRVHAHLCFVSQHRPSLLIAEDGRGTGQSVTLGDEFRLLAGAPELIDSLDSALSLEEARGFPSLHRAVDEIERTWPVMKSTIEQLPGGPTR